MNTSSTQDETFICPLCNIDNRAAAKYCRRCGISRTVLSTHAPKPAPSRAVNDVSDVHLMKPLLGHPGIANRSSLPVTPAIHATSGSAVMADVSASKGESGTISASTDSLAVADTSYVHPECPNCQTMVRASDRFCCWCGEMQPARLQPLLKNCSECAQSLPERANYCFVCGRNVGPNNFRMRVPTELFKEESSEFFPTFDA